MSVRITLLLAAAMAVIAVLNTGLAAWLWRFPMVPDPTGRDPNGVSTAPRSWTAVHRVLGYLFAACYLGLLTEMLPRLWQFREFTLAGGVHAALGVLLGIVLVAKVAIIRRFQRFGGRLPWFGGTLTAVTLGVVALGAAPAIRVVRPFSPVPAALAPGREVLVARCFQCHGAATIASEREDARKWDRLVREMQRRSRRFAGKTEITDAERQQVVPYLVHILGEDDEDDEVEAETEADVDREDDRGRRRRRRGRD